MLCLKSGELIHYGIKGMRWGVRHDKEKTYSLGMDYIEEKRDQVKKEKAEFEDRKEVANSLSKSIRMVRLTLDNVLREDMAKRYGAKEVDYFLKALDRWNSLDEESKYSQENVEGMQNYYNNLLDVYYDMLENPLTEEEMNNLSESESEFMEDFWTLRGKMSDLRSKLPIGGRLDITYDGENLSFEDFSEFYKDKDAEKLAIRYTNPYGETSGPYNVNDSEKLAKKVNDERKKKWAFNKRKDAGAKPRDKIFYRIYDKEGNEVDSVKPVKGEKLEDRLRRGAKR